MTMWKYVIRGNRGAAIAGAALSLLGMLGCNGGSSPQPFAGITQNYIVAGGKRTLALTGTTGTYTAVTLNGPQISPVSLTSTRMIVGGVSGPYLADHNLIQGGGYVGFASSGVISNPAVVPGTYNTLTGANFAGQLTITNSSHYSWCQRSSFTSSNSCADGSTPATGQIVVQAGGGFMFSGMRGTYAAYRQGSAAILFPIDNRGVNLKAVSQDSMVPNGTYFQALSCFSGTDTLTIRGVPNFSGSKTYTNSNGAIRFASANCRGGVCTGSYNSALGIVYLAQIGNAFFFTR